LVDGSGILCLGESSRWLDARGHMARVRTSLACRFIRLEHLLLHVVWNPESQHPHVLNVSFGRISKFQCPTLDGGL